MSFNSLFEMPVVPLTVYGWGGVTVGFNSLFEMHARSHASAEGVHIRVSILYLRCCSLSRPRPVGPGPCGFNSLFEMRTRRAEISNPVETFQFSI